MSVKKPASVPPEKLKGKALMRGFVRSCASLAFALAATGATPQPSSPVSGGASEMVPTPATTLAHAYGQFGFDTLRELRARKPGANVFISPTSIALAFAMVANGANGATQTAILKTLGTSDQSIASLDAANQSLIATLNAQQKVQLAVANALWLQDGFEIEPAFLRTLQTQYGAQATNVDFKSGAAAPAINDWAAKHTNDRIKKIVGAVNPSTILMLTNAVAFKATWTFPFDPGATQPHDFTTAASTVLKVPMMSHTGRYSYANANGIETIRLPYADGNFAMYVVLPKDASTMDSFVRDLTPDAFESLVSSLGNGRGTIELPRFTISYDATLNPVLDRLGMGIVFGNDADFNGIHHAPPAIRIDLVRHASFLKVDEEGTEASAVTSIGMTTMAMQAGPPPFHMIVDRPFFVAIRDEQSGQILFTGSIEDPAT